MSKLPDNAEAVFMVNGSLSADGEEYDEGRPGIQNHPHATESELRELTPMRLLARRGKHPMNEPVSDAASWRWSRRPRGRRER